MRWLLAALLLLSLQAQAQEDERIITDTPSLATSSYTVPAGHWQWEALAEYDSGKTTPLPSRRRAIEDRNESSDADLYTLPQLIRYGLSDRLELRLETDSLSFQGRNQGFDDVSIGCKWNFHRDETVSLGVTTLLSLPVGGTAFTSHQVLPSVIGSLDWQLTPDDSLSFNLGTLLETTQERNFLQGLTTLGYSHDLTEDLSLYVEGAVIGPGTPGGPLETVVDGGLSVYMTRTWVLNLAVFKGLSASGGNWGGTVGFGVRL